MDLSKLIEDEALRAKVEDELAGVLTKNKELLADVKRYKSQVLPDVSETDLDELKQFRAEREEMNRKQQEAKGEYEKLTKTLMDKHQQELDRMQQELQSTTQTRDQFATQTLLRQELAKAGVTDTAELLMPHITPKVKLNVADTGDFALTYGEDKSVGDLLAELKSNPAFTPAFKPVNQGGGASGSGGANADVNNPFKTGNRTEQAKLMNTDPERAKMLAKQAGISFG